jgi:aldehyde:ferredoxin oxidoreductase
MVERGIQGKILNVHLGERKIEPESLSEELYCLYLGGYGWALGSCLTVFL